MKHFGITTDYEYRADHKRDRLNVWSGPFMGVWEASGLSLQDGYMLTTYNGEKIRVECPTPRTDDNYPEIDRAINDALNAHYGDRA